MKKKCVACDGRGRWWERGEPMQWRAPHEGVLLDKYGNAKLSNTEIVTCKVCKGEKRV